MSKPAREKAIKFGDGTALIGILTEPPRGTEPVDGPAVILLNSGLLHRVGAARLYVRLARRLARQGFRVFRFDFSGIGDSDPRRDSLTFEESAVLEVGEAMDLLARTRKVERFVLMGLCSGADMGFRAAGGDERVVGVVQLDAWAYRTPGYWLHHYGRRALDPEVWKTFIKTRVRRLAAGSNGSAGPASSDDETVIESPYAREFPPREQVARELKQLVDRRVCLLNIFSGGQPFAFNHAGQYRRAFSDIDFQDLLEVEYDGRANHIFSGLADQQFVLDRVTRWMERFLPAHQGAGTD